MKYGLLERELNRSNSEVREKVQGDYLEWIWITENQVAKFKATIENCVPEQENETRNKIAAMLKVKTYNVVVERTKVTNRVSFKVSAYTLLQGWESSNSNALKEVAARARGKQLSRPSLFARCCAAICGGSSNKPQSGFRRLN